MLRNILVQSAFQVALILILLFNGANWFDVPFGNACKKYDVDTNSRLWDLNTLKQSPTGTFTCADFNDYCKGDGVECFQATRNLTSVTANGIVWKEAALSDLDNFETNCLTCHKLDYHHYSIIFNAFIFCQIFNEFTAHSIGDEWNFAKNMHFNGIFAAVIIITLGCQILLINFGGEFVKTAPLTLNQWLITIALGAIGIPIGMAMRFIPAPEDPKSFFDNSTPTAIAEPVTNGGKKEIDAVLP